MNSSSFVLEHPWHMLYHQSVDFSHSSVFLFAGHNSKNLWHIEYLLNVKRGDPAGSPPVAGLTGFCNAITVFILPDHKLHVKQFIQFLQYMQNFLFNTISDNIFNYHGAFTLSPLNLQIVVNNILPVYMARCI